MRNKLIILNIIIIPLLTGCGFLINKQPVTSDTQKYYLGTASTKNFQTFIKDILLENGYYIDEYEQDAYSSHLYSFQISVSLGFSICNHHYYRYNFQYE